MMLWLLAIGYYYACTYEACTWEPKDEEELTLATLTTLTREPTGGYVGLVS